MEKKSQNYEGLTQDDFIKQLHNNPQELNALLAGITTENIHKEVDYGSVIGKETL